MRGRWANLGGSLAVLAVVLGLSVGLPAVERALPDDRAVPPKLRLTVGHDVSLVPPRGSVLDSAETFPNRGRMVLEVRGVRYALAVSTYQGTLRQALNRLRDRIDAQRGYQLSGPTYQERTSDGVTGWAGRFTTSRRDGYFAVFVNTGRVVEIVAQGAGLGLDEELSLVRGSVATVRFGGAQ
ncbi:MAG: hypothetical protein ACRDUA_05050 [Micromonosporaceae bacterium]